MAISPFSKPHLPTRKVRWLLITMFYLVVRYTLFENHWNVGLVSREIVKVWLMMWLCMMYVCMWLDCEQDMSIMETWWISYSAGWFLIMSIQCLLYIAWSFHATENNVWNCHSIVFLNDATIVVIKCTNIRCREYISNIGITMIQLK